MQLHRTGLLLRAQNLTVFELIVADLADFPQLTDLGMLFNMPKSLASMPLRSYCFVEAILPVVQLKAQY
ncbi:MAG: hypothetical protein ABJN14_18260 [Paracoccaceae bacterium]